MREAALVCILLGAAFVVVGAFLPPSLSGSSTEPAPQGETVTTWWAPSYASMGGVVLLAAGAWLALRRGGSAGEP